MKNGSLSLSALLPPPNLEFSSPISQLKFQKLCVNLIFEVEACKYFALVIDPSDSSRTCGESWKFTEELICKYMMHAFYPGAYMPVPYAYWPPNAASREEEEEEDKEAENYHHQILKPILILPKEPVNVDELVGMSHLSIIETAERRYRDPSPLSLKLLGEPSMQSAFLANAPVSNPDLSNGRTSPIQAI